MITTLCNTSLSHHHLWNCVIFLQVIEECGCVSGQILHSRQMLGEYQYCGSMAVNGIEFVQRMNCSFYVNNQILTDADCNCPISCKETLYQYTVTQSPWPHLSYHIPLYNKYIQNQSFAHHFDWYYYDLAALEFTENESLIYPQLRETDLISRNFIQLHVKMESDLLVKYVDKQSLEWESFVGSLGGLLNLWTGVTFIAIIELVELVYNLTCSKQKVGDAK